MKGSNNPEARERTILLLAEHGESVGDWVTRLARDNQLTREEIIAHGVKRGFIDEEMDGAWIDCQRSPHTDPLRSPIVTPLGHPM